MLNVLKDFFKPVPLIRDGSLSGTCCLPAKHLVLKGKIEDKSGIGVAPTPTER